MKELSNNLFCDKLFKTNILIFLLISIPINICFADNNAGNIITYDASSSVNINEQEIPRSNSNVSNILEEVEKTILFSMKYGEAALIETIREYFKELSLHEQILIKFSNFSKSDLPIKNFIKQKVAEKGFVPIDLDEIREIFLNNEDPEFSRNTLEDIIKDQEKNGTVLKFSLTKVKDQSFGFSEDFLLDISYNNTEYQISFDHFILIPENLEKIISAVLQEVSKINLKSENSEKINREIREKKSDRIKSLVYDKALKKLYLTRYLGQFFLLLDDRIQFIDGILMYDGRIFSAEFQTDFKDLDVTKEIFLTRDFKFSFESAQNLKTKALITFSAPIIFLWDNYIILSDGNIGDLTLTWWLKISNTPIDYIVSDNKIYLLDITNNLYIVNLKTRRTILQIFCENAYMIKLEYDSTEKNNVLWVYGYDKIFKLSSDKELSTINIEKTSDRYNDDGRAISTIFYPSILKITVSPFGYFYEDLHLGSKVYHTYIRELYAYIITDVGTWRIKLSE
ncbi:MAG: hypothetical protein ACK4F9_07350 [Brevinematia bacterium]